MAFIALSKPFQLKPRIYPRISNPLLFFTTSQDPISAPEEKMLKNQQTPHGKTRNSEKVEDIICRMMENGAWTTGLQKSIRALVPDFDHSLVYNVLHGAKDSKRALQFFRWVERAGLIRHDREAHLKIIQILVRASKLDDARSVLLDMPKKGIEWDEDFFASLINSYGSAGKVDEAEKIFHKMKELGVDRTIKSYDAFLKVISRRSFLDRLVERYFNEMLSEGIEPTCHSYNLLLSCSLKSLRINTANRFSEEIKTMGFDLSRRLDTANRFYEDMKTRGIPPDAVTYNKMINAYFWFRRVNEAEKLFAEMKGMNLERTVTSYTTMIKGYVAVEQVDNGLRLFEEMRSLGIKPNATTYSALLPGLCDAGKMSEAKNIWEEMVERNIAPKDDSVFMKLLKGLCNSGDLNAAADVLNATTRLGIPTHAGHYGVLIENFCKANEFDRATELLDTLVHKDILRIDNSTC